MSKSLLDRLENSPMDELETTSFAEAIGYAIDAYSAKGMTDEDMIAELLGYVVFLRGDKIILTEKGAQYRLEDQIKDEQWKHFARDLTAKENNTMSYEDEYATALDCPEDFLWVRYTHEGERRYTCLSREALWELKTSQKPSGTTEELLIQNPEWLDIYLKHIIGTHVITIDTDDDEPLWVWTRAYYDDDQL